MKQYFFSLALLSFTSVTYASDDYCISIGGTPIAATMLDFRHQLTKFKRSFCQLQFSNEGLKLVGSETLALPTESIIWHHFHYSTPTFEPAPGAASPAAAYCLKLGGLYANWRHDQTGDESGTCAFEDGSIASDWLLFYTAGRLPQCAGAFRYQGSP